MKTIILIIIYLPLLLFGQNNTVLENEIKSLVNKEEIKSYWNFIHVTDQSNRGGESKYDVDLVNFKRVVLMIKYHGYPVGFRFGTDDSSENKNYTPNIVFTHVKAVNVKEYFFPILYNAYKDNIADEFYFLHSLNSILLGRFDRNFYPKTSINIYTNIKLISDYVDTNRITYDLNLIDSLDCAYRKQVNEIINSKVVFSCKTKIKSILEIVVRDRILIYNYCGEYYLLLKYRDDTYNLPQSVYYDNNKNVIKFKQLEDVKSFYSSHKKIIPKRKYRKLVRMLAN